MYDILKTIIPVKPKVISNPNENCFHFPHSVMVPNSNKFGTLRLTKDNAVIANTMLTKKIKIQIVIKYNSYFNLLYSSSDTRSNHSFEPSFAGTSTAICVNQLSFAAPCQCFVSGGIFTTSPG